MSLPQPKLNEHHLHHLLEERAVLLAEVMARVSVVKKLNAQILETLIAADVDRHQMTTGALAGALVYIVKPDPRQTVVPEKLLGLGVSPDVIRGATVTTAVSPYIRVDAPRTGEAVAPALTAETVADPPVTDETDNPVH
jgi:hypothetical protein